MATSDLDIRRLCEMLRQPSTRDQAIAELQDTLKRLLEMFLPDPQAFCSLLTETASVITGHAALWFMMRDDQLPKPATLTVTCPRHRFDTVYSFLAQLPGAEADPYPEDLFLSDWDRANTFGVNQRMRFETVGGVIEMAVTSLSEEEVGEVVLGLARYLSHKGMLGEDILEALAGQLGRRRRR